MAVDPIFSEAWIHNLPPDFTSDDPWSNHVVLGRRMRPFSLWHRLLLRDIESPLLDAARAITPQDLDKAVSICRCRYQQVNFAARPVYSPTLLWHVAAGGLAKGTAAFAEYLRDFCARPDYVILPNPNVKGPPPLPLGRPETELSQAATVIGWSHWTDRYVWELPECQVEHYAAMAQEAAGARLDFTDASKRSFEAQLDEKLAREAAEKEKQNPDGNRT